MTATRYQVFISSTFTDLVDARSEVQRALLRLKCFPAGMELFPAIDEQQLEFIKKIIDDSDYYVVLIAGRYGSTTPDGISYTEREFDYAASKGLPILAFLHGDPNSIPVGQSDLDPIARERLEMFRTKVSKDRLVNYWKTPEDLATKVTLSLVEVINTRPGVGWQRGSQIDPTELLSQINDLRQRNETLTADLARRDTGADVGDLAHGAELVKILVRPGVGDLITITATWDEVFARISPTLISWTGDDAVNTELAYALSGNHPLNTSYARIEPETFKTLRVQLSALGLVEVKSLQTTTGGMALFWRLTATGQKHMFRLRTVKSVSPEIPTRICPTVDVK